MLPELSPAIKRRGRPALLAAILCLALLLRVRGVRFGLPYLYHPDEDAVLMPALSMLKTGDLEPSRMEYGTGHIYLLAAVSAAVFALQAQDGRIADPEELSIFERGSYPAIYDRPEFFVAARLISAAMGAATVLLLYMLARRLGNGNERLGLLVAALAAVLPALVADSHFATTDTPLVFWVTLSLYLLLRAYDQWEHDSPWAYAGAGLVCGLAASTKYNGVVLAVPLLLVPLLRVRSLDALLRFRVLAGPLGMAAGFLLATPYALLALPRFLTWFGYSLHLYNAPRELPLPPWQWHLQYHLTSPHALVIVLGLIGAAWSVRAWGRRALIPLSFVLALWAAILSQTNLQARMWLPTAPAVLLWAGLALDGLMGVWRHARPPLTQRPLVAYAPLLILAPLLWTSIQYGSYFQADDVRTVAQRWIETHLPAGAAVAVDYFGPNLDPAVWPVTRQFQIIDQPVTWYQAQGIRYVVISQAISDPQNLGPVAREEYETFTRQSCLLTSLEGVFIMNPGFHIHVYQVPPCTGS